METQRKVKTLDGYTIIKTLGYGVSSKVKLAVNTKTGEEVAIKIIKESFVQSQSKFTKYVLPEITTLMTLNNPSIIKLIEWSQDGILTKGSGEKKEGVVYMVLELARGGHMYEYIGKGSYLSEPVVRFYFKQIFVFKSQLQVQRFASPFAFGLFAAGFFAQPQLCFTLKYLPRSSG